MTIRRTTLEIQFAEGMTGDAPDRVLVIPWTPSSPYQRREIIQGEGEQPAAVRPMRTRARAILIDALRDAHRWLDELTTNSSLTIESHRCPREEDRTLDPPDDVARLAIS